MSRPKTKDFDKNQLRSRIQTIEHQLREIDLKIQKYELDRSKLEYELSKYQYQLNEYEYIHRRDKYHADFEDEVDDSEGNG